MEDASSILSSLASYVGNSEGRERKERENSSFATVLEFLKRPVLWSVGGLFPTISAPLAACELLYVGTTTDPRVEFSRELGLSDQL